MGLTNLFIKVRLELEEGEEARKLAEEICRRVEKIYGVRSAEISSISE